MKKIIWIVAIVMLFIGCGSDTTINEGNTTIIVEASEDNTTIVIPSDNVSPYGAGTIDDPYAFYKDGTYRVNENTFFVSNPIDANCTITVRPRVNRVVYDVVLYDELYDTIDPIVFIEEWQFKVPIKGFYNINIKSYESVDVVLTADCWDK